MYLVRQQGRRGCKRLVPPRLDNEEEVAQFTNTGERDVCGSTSDIQGRRTSVTDPKRGIGPNDESKEVHTRDGVH